MACSDRRPKGAMSTHPLTRQTAHQAVMSGLHGRRQPSRRRQSRVAHVPFRSERSTSWDGEALPPSCTVVPKRPAQISAPSNDASRPSFWGSCGGRPFGRGRFTTPDAKACGGQRRGRPRPLESTWHIHTLTTPTSHGKQMVREAAECDRVDKRITRLDLREKRPTFAALERRGCGEIGRHARFRIWCFGVWVRVPPPAHFQGPVRQPESPS